MDNFLTDEQIREDWPPEFHGFIGNKRVKFLTTGEVQVELSNDVTTEKESYTKLVTIKDVTAGDLMACDSVKGDFAKGAAMISAAAGLPLASVKRLKGRDFMLLQKVANAFLGIGPETGETV